MFELEKKPVLASILIALLTIAVLIPASVGHCQQKHKGEWILPENYPPGGFDGWGRIDRLGNIEVVIDDTLYPLSASVTFHAPSADNVSASWLQTGNLVGFLTNMNGEVISLWRIDN